jgi:hypothetical protein
MLVVDVNRNRSAVVAQSGGNGFLEARQEMNEDVILFLIIFFVVMMFLSYAAGIRTGHKEAMEAAKKARLGK